MAEPNVEKIQSETTEAPIQEAIQESPHDMIEIPGLTDSIAQEPLSVAEEEADEKHPAKSEDQVPEDEAVEESGDEEEEPQENGQKIPLDLVARGIKSGLELDQILKFESAKDLEAALTLVEQMRPQQQAEQSADRPPMEKPAELENWYELSEELKEQFDENLLSAMSGMNDHAKKAFMSMHEQMSRMAEMQQIQAVQMRDQRFEQGVNALGTDWDETLGKGEVDDITTAQLDNRRKLFAALDKVQALDSEGGQNRSMKKQLQDALGMAFPEQIKESAKRELRSKIDSRTKVRRPVNKVSKNAGQEIDDPIKFIEEWQKSRQVEQEEVETPFFA